MALLWQRLVSRSAFTVLFSFRICKEYSKDLEEAASIDGAGIYQVFFRIVFPLMKPIILTSVVLNTLNVWNDFQMSRRYFRERRCAISLWPNIFFLVRNSIELGLAFALLSCLWYLYWFCILHYRNILSAALHLAQLRDNIWETERTASGGRRNYGTAG